MTHKDKNCTEPYLRSSIRSVQSIFMALSVFSTSLTGIQSGITRLHVSADNTARANVPNAAKNKVANSTGAQGGVETRVQKVPLDNKNTEITGDGSISTNIDYGEEAVSRNVAAVTTKANLRVLKTAADMEDQILDIIV